eukprot:TRINITY_DN34061_c0_g1_i1.p2 TRINITY_DN34061_c0_g1~~TRINITY_DN34061_c0_g1_i1.p2  ORF type:complete len:206 (-),score=45.03 TRINITY_DN34061_c0_g1_i1:57-641(-)
MAGMGFLLTVCLILTAVVVESSGPQWEDVLQEREQAQRRRDAGDMEHPPLTSETSVLSPLDAKVLSDSAPFHHAASDDDLEAAERALQQAAEEREKYHEELLAGASRNAVEDAAIHDKAAQQIVRAKEKMIKDSEAEKKREIEWQWKMDPLKVKALKAERDYKQGKERDRVEHFRAMTMHHFQKENPDVLTMME